MLPTRRSPAPTAKTISVRFGASVITRSTRAGNVTLRPASSVSCWVAEGVSVFRAGAHASAKTSSAKAMKCLKSRNKKVPPTSVFAKGKQASAGLENESRVRPETPCASVERLQSAWAGLLALRKIEVVSHHSGATARDSHPLPYSPLPGHPDACLSKDRSNARDTNTHSSACQLNPCSPVYSCS